jgi:KRAB domain-containing zinc finger protein
VRSVGDALFDDSVDDEPDKDLPECKVKRNYSCSACDFFTQNPRHYLHHLRDVHEERVRIYECPNCLYASRHFQKLLRHSKMVHGDDEPATTPPPTDAADAEPAAFKCSVCAFAARTRPQLERHERAEHIKTKFFRCTKCTYATHMKARFTKHVKYHSMPMIKCDMCDFRTPYKWNLDRHCKNHNGRGAFRCSACNFTADIKQSLTVHEMNHHVPPVGQAAGLGVGRRRNKVGASDATAAEEAARQEQVTMAVIARRGLIAAELLLCVQTVRAITPRRSLPWA